MAKKPRIKLQDRIAADFAEAILSPSYRQALNDDFTANPDSFIEHTDNTQQILLGSLATIKDSQERAWEARRLATIAQIGEQSIGYFSEYLHSTGGAAKPTDLTLEDLPPGEPDAVRINTQIMSLSKLHEDPIDFIDSAFNAIERYVVDSGAKTNVVGPENYATTLKIFADKFRDFPNSHLDETIIRERANKCLAGFDQAASQEEPNFVEMTNIYSAILTLPMGVVAKEHTTMLVMHSAGQLPKYNSKTLALLVASLGKIDLSDTNDFAATLVDLALRKNKGLETTREFRSVLRTISKLPESQAANRAFTTFLDKSHDLQKPLDIEGLDETNQLLLTIVSNVVDDPVLCLKIKDIAFKNAYHANEILKQKRNDGYLTKTQMDELVTIVNRIGQNFAKI